MRLILLDLDLQSEIVHLIQEHNEARLIKEKECKKSPVSTFGHSNPSTPCSADLEEGEIREDSSDDETVIREEGI